MKNTFSSTSDISPNLRGGVVVIGNFDGVHLGHRAVLNEALEIASANNIPALVLTFEPHPRTWFRSDNPVFRLTPPAHKAEYLLELGFDAVVSETFDADFASLTAEEFIRSHLVENLGSSHVVTGFNFHFGKARAGTPQYLSEAGKKHGFNVVQVERFADAAHERVSSSRIRAALEDGEISNANTLLGRPYKVTGTVVKGAQLGRTLGFPTANIKLPEENLLHHGIYAVKMVRADGAKYDGVASFGQRPTFDNGAPLLETFVFDFSDNLYDEEISIEFYGWIRPEEKFDGVDALVKQMNKDSIAARKILNFQKV